MKYLTLLFACPCIALASVKPSSVSLEEIPRAERFASFKEKDLAKQLKKYKDPLARAALYQYRQDWKNCVIQSLNVSSKSIVYDYALKLALDCGREILTEDEKKSNKAQQKVLSGLISKVLVKARYFSSADLHTASAAISSLRQLRLQYAQWLKNHSQWKELSGQLKILLDDEPFYSKEERGLIFLLAGELMVAERKWENVYWQFERASQLSNDAQTDARVKAIIPMLPAKYRAKVEDLTRGAAEEPAPSPNSSHEEQEMFNQAQSYINRRDSGAISALAKLIRKFPGGLKAKWAQDRLFEMLNYEMEKSRTGGVGPSVNKKKILNEMYAFDSDRQAEWARILYAAQNYEEAAYLYQKAAEQISGSQRAGKYFYMAGRGFQLAGRFEDAEKMYDIVTKFYPAISEYVDAALQWALININSNQPSDAITHLEMARTRKLTSQQDQISLFWLYQAYKARKTKDGMEITSRELIEKYPTSYYGLIVFDEINGHLPKVTTSGSKTGKIYLSEAEKKAVARAKALMAVGLLDAATDELNFLTTRPLSIDESLYFANFFTQTFNYPKAYNLIVGVLDEARDRQNLFLLKAMFPKEYWDILKDDKLRSSLDPYLVLSIIKQESAFGYKAISRSNAHGLMQLIPPTAEEVKRQIGYKGEIPQALFIPEVNIQFGSTYFNGLLKRFNNSIPQALASYNAGPTRLNTFINSQGGSLRETWVDELPWSETSHYVKAILRNYVWYRMLYSDMQKMPAPPWASPGKEQASARGKGKSN